MIVPVLALSAMVTLASSWVGSTMQGDIIAYAGPCPMGDTRFLQYSVFAADLKRNLRATIRRDVIVAQLAWSPDGRQLAFAMRAHDHSSWDLYVMDANGDHSLIHASTTENETYPTWSPDGKRLGFMRSAPVRDQALQFRALDIDSGVIQRISVGDLTFFNPVWSPDGKDLLFAAIARRENAPDSYNIYTMNLESGETNFLTDDFFDNHSPDWSPDGGQIVYIRAKRDAAGHNYEVRLLSLSGDGVRLHESDKALWSPRWSPDGKRIGFIAVEFDFDLSERRNLHVMDADGGDVRRLGLPCYVTDYSWRP